MLIMTWGLYRGRRLAAWAFIIVGLGESCIAMLYYFVAPLSHAPQGLRSLLLHGAIPASIANVLLPMVFAIAVACSMHHFPIRTDAGRLRRGSAAVVIALAVCIAAYLGFGLLRPGDFRPPATWHGLMHELPSRFIPIGFLNRSRPSFLPRTVAASVVDQAVGLVFWLVVLVVAVRWMREILLVDGRARANACRLVELDGESMSFMTTWEGNHYWFSATGRSAMAYRVIHGIALTTTGRSATVANGRPTCASSLGSACSSHGRPCYTACIASSATSLPPWAGIRWRSAARWWSIPGNGRRPARSGRTSAPPSTRRNVPASAT